jgi:hypothetical protein
MLGAVAGAAATRLRECIERDSQIQGAPLKSPGSVAEGGDGECVQAAIPK